MNSRVTQLSVMQKTDLFAFSHTETAKSLWELMENVVVEARDEAMAIDPAEEKIQKARMDTAHAMAKFYTRIRKEIESLASEQMGEIERLANEEILKDQELIEAIVLDQAVNPMAVRRL